MEAPPDPAPLAASSAPLRAPEVARLREEQEKVVTGCRERIQHWEKVDGDYDALQERLRSLPDKLSYSIMVPFGPFAFMPGKLVHTNEVTVLLGDNWFAKCSAKQAAGLVEHRKGHVRKTIDDLEKVVKSFESRLEFTEDLQKMSNAAGDIVDIREEIGSDFELRAKHRIAHKPHSRPKTSDVFEADFTDDVKPGDVLADEALWARLEELERREELLGELRSEPDTVIADGGETTSSDEEQDRSGDASAAELAPEAPRPSCGDGGGTGSDLPRGRGGGLPNCAVNGSHSCHSEDEDEDEDEDEHESGPDAAGAGDSSVPTIYFSHTVEPKRVRINTGKNTTLKFSEKKEEAKRKRKSSCGGSHAAPELPAIRTPADIYRVFVDVVNGEYVPRKSILKSRSRENSVCSDTGESALEEEPEGPQRSPAPDPEVPEAFSGTVVEKESSPFLGPHAAAARPGLPPIPERREDGSRRLSRFKAARLQQQS